VSRLAEHDLTVTGECFCGEVKYRVNGKLFDARSCHCSRCRKAFSSQASAYALVNHEEFEWVGGESFLKSYTNQNGYGLQFCSQCGSTLCGIFDGVVHGVTLGCVNGDPQIGPIKHIYVGSKAKWETIPGGLIQFDEGVTG